MGFAWVTSTSDADSSHLRSFKGSSMPSTRIAAGGCYHIGRPAVGHDPGRRSDVDT